MDGTAVEEDCGGEDNVPETSRGAGGHCPASAIFTSGDQQGSGTKSERQEASPGADSCHVRTVCSPEGVQTHPQSTPSQEEAQGRTYPQALDDQAPPQTQEQGTHPQEVQEEETHPQAASPHGTPKDSSRGGEPGCVKVQSGEEEIEGQAEGEKEKTGGTVDSAGKENEDILFDMKTTQSAGHEAVVRASDHVIPVISDGGSAENHPIPFTDKTKSPETAENPAGLADHMIPPTKDGQSSQGLSRRAESPVGSVDHVIPQDQSMPRRTESPVAGGSDGAGSAANPGTTVKKESRKSFSTAESDCGVGVVDGVSGVKGIDDSTLTSESSVGGVNSVSSGIGGESGAGDDVSSVSDLRSELMAKIRLLEGEKAELATQLKAGKEKEASFQEIAKELENKCFKQQEQIESLELEHDTAIERLQQREKEVLLKVDQMSEQLSAASKDKEGLMGKLASLQEDQMNLIDQITDKEKKIKELSKDTEKLEVLVKKQRAEVLKLQSSLEKSETHCSQLTQDVAKEKQEVSSLNIKVKWAQNKLKAESEAHKAVKSQLEVTTKRLNQSREEGEQIRADLKQMIQQYQESEDMKSNSLDIQLKKTERELKQHEQEIADQQELHELTVKELELTKNAHKISQEEIQHHKQKISEMSSHANDLVSEIEELKGALLKQKQENKRLASELSELEQRTQGFDKERVKFAQLREVFTQLQKSNQHLEKEVEKRKEREAELLAFSAKLSSSNAELTAERADWEAKVTSLSSERDTFASRLSESKEAQVQLEESMKELHDTSQTEISNLLDKLDGKTKAVEQLSMALEDERESVKATKKKNLNIIKDLQKQLQSSKRRIESLEASIASDKEPPATLPISRASSHSSLDGAMPPPTSASVNIAASSALHPPPSSSSSSSSAAIPRHTPHQTHDHAHLTDSTVTGPPATITLSDDERVGATPSPEYKFGIMDQEKLLLVEKLCSLKKELVKQEEKVDFFEEHISQLTEDIQKKSRIIQNFIMREQAGALAPPSFDENRLRQAKKGGVMGTVFAGGKNARVYKVPEVNLELSLEMNKKMQSVLEDTLLKNITLKENIDTLGREIQRISAQLQTYEKLKK